ncbi:MAG: hypothetical protein COA78_09640 [Blastopirellula sp.]|nr:MAG: hypothetical protein COA78_09640 [Blastopirellula sp.]
MNKTDENEFSLDCILKSTKNRHFSVNSTTSNLLPDNNIEIQIIILNPFKRCLTPWPKGAKEEKERLPPRHEDTKEKRSFKHRGTERTESWGLHFILSKKRFSREASKPRSREGVLL